MSRNMTKKVIKHKGILLLVILCCIFSCFTGVKAATKKPKLSKKNVTLEVGKSVKIKVLNVSKKSKIKWTVKSKKIATVKNGKITAKKKGKTKVYAVVDKKKLVCNVTVKSAEKKTTSPAPVATSQVTSAPQNTVSPSVVPTSPAVPTPTVSPTLAPTDPPSDAYDEGLTSGLEEDFEKYFAKDRKKYTKWEDGVEKGNLEDITYESSVVGASREAYVYTPAGYDEDVKYPVVYMLHGFGCDRNQWIGMKVQCILDNMIARKEIKPVVAVFPSIIPKDGINDDTPAADKIQAYSLFTEEFKQDLVPYILENYSVSEDRKDTGICGLSMGGMKTLELGFSMQDRFNYIGSFSAAPSLDLNLLQYTDENIKPELVILCNGSKDGPSPLEYHNELTKNNVKHMWYIYPGQGHTEVVWVNGAINFLSRSYGE